MESAAVVFVADGLAGGAEGFLVKVVAVRVELVFCEILVVRNGVVWGELGFDELPGVSFAF